MRVMLKRQLNALATADNERELNYKL